MTGQEIVELIGLSIHHPKTEKMLKYFALKKPKASHYSSFMAWNEEKGVSIDFRPKVAFEKDFLDPPHKLVFEFPLPLSEEYLNSESMELIVESVTFEKSFKEKLPFGLHFGDSPENLPELGKSYLKEKNSDRSNWFFLTQKYNILTSLDPEKKLNFVRVWLIANNIKLAIRRKENLKFQNKNINPDSIQTLIEWTHLSPTDIWRKRMTAGDSLFSEDKLASFQVLLEKFIHSIQEAVKKKNATKIFNSVKMIVTQFNKLNKKFKCIETQEREELCAFINTVVKKTGFKLGEGEDITQEWRQW